jgi:hypothetical protein
MLSQSVLGQPLLLTESAQVRGNSQQRIVHAVTVPVRGQEYQDLCVR